MRPLPRLHAVTDAAVLAREDLPVRAAALAALGSAVAIHVRDRSALAGVLVERTARIQRLAAPPGAAVFASARGDIAAALATQGLHLGQADLEPGEVRRALGERWHGWLGVSVHSIEEARAARDGGADYLMAGNIYPTATHPGRPARGLGFVEEVAELGLPVIAIGGLTAGRAGAAKQAGAWGVAAISALWHADDAYASAVALVAPWTDDAA
jgi:thiamine-phosphate pyrophosphorylase